MKSIDIKELGLNDQFINELLRETVVSIDEDGKTLFYLVPCGDNNEKLQTPDFSEMSPDIRIIGPGGLSLTYDQYVSAREELISIFDRCFKPDAEKMN